MDGDDMMGGGQWRKRPFQDDDQMTMGYGSYGGGEDPTYRGMEPPATNYRKQDQYQNYNQSYTGGYKNQQDQSSESDQVAGNSWSSFFDESGSFNPDGSQSKPPAQKPKPNPNQSYNSYSQGFNDSYSGQTQGYKDNYGGQNDGYGQTTFTSGYDFSQDVPMDKDNQSWGRGGGGQKMKRGGGGGGRGGMRGGGGRGGGGGGRGGGGSGRGGGGGGRGGGGGAAKSSKPWGQGSSPWSTGEPWEQTQQWQDMMYDAFYSGNQAEAGGGGGYKRDSRGGRGRGGRGGWDRGGRGSGGRGGGNDRGRGQRGAQRGGGRGRGNQGYQQNKPGMPPNQIGGRRGGMKQTNVPPVHSMTNVIKMDVSQMSTAEKIRRFCLFLQSDASKVNAIQTIENGITGSKLGLKTDYVCEELMKVANKWMYTGCLTLSGVFLARSVGGNKKEVKHDTYAKALDILKSKTVAEIYAGVDPGPDAIRNELSSSLDKDMDINNQATRALEKQEQLATTLASKEEGFIKLIHYLKTFEKLPESKIGAIEQAAVASKCGMEHKYEDSQARLPTGKMIFRGQLIFEGIIIGAATAHKRKEAKIQTYIMAYESLMHKPITEVIKGVPDEDFVTGDQALFTAAAAGENKKNMSLPEKLGALMSIIKDVHFQENNINTIDCSALHLGLTPTCIYRKSVEEGGPTSLICEMYLDNVLIGSGESERRKDSQIEAYNSAYDTLCTSTADYILKEHKRLKPEDTNDPNIVDVWVKGEGRHNVDSNMAGLKRYKCNHLEEGKTVEKFVILEHDDWGMDRKRQAFCILNYSATLNGMLLQWNIEADGSLFKCEIKLQGQHIGEAHGPSKSTVRNLAAADALFRLYETQSVVKVLRRDDSQLWIAYENIASKAEAVKQASGEEDIPEEIQEEPKKEEVKMEEGTEKKEGDKKDYVPLPPPNKWVMKIVEEILNTYNGNQTLDELIFGPGMPIPEKKALSDMARGLELKVNTRQRDGQGYIVIHKTFPPPEMVRILLLNQGSSGKYSLIPGTNLPKHSDIEGDLRRVTPPVKATGEPPRPPVHSVKKGVSLIKGQQAQSIMMKLAGVDTSSMDSESYEKPKINWL